MATWADIFDRAEGTDATVESIRERLGTLRERRAEGEDD